MAFSFAGSACTPVIYGNGLTTQNLMALTNKVGSRVNLYIRRASVQLDPILALTSVMPQVKLSRCDTSLISGGYISPHGNYNATETSSDSVIFRTSMLQDAPITATAGPAVWQQYCSRMHTVVEQVQAPDNNLLPLLATTIDFILRPGESILAQVVGLSTASNATLSNNWFINLQWQEEPVPTFNISGTVRLSAAPVAGAIVTVIEADDESMTNPILVEKIVTDGGGAWASTISSGKVGAAFVQYKAGATYYTAPGSPYLE